MAMILELHKILYGEVDHIPRTRGRTRSTSRDADIRLITGTMTDRISHFLRDGESYVASDIAAGVAGTVTQVSRALKKMVESGVAEVVAIEGCAREYMLVTKA